MKVVCVGDCGVDLYSPENKLYPGGITANFTKQARKLFKLNDEVHIISMIGTDGDAAELAYLSTDLPGIECHIERKEGRTPVQYISIREDGEKNFTRYDEGVLKSFYLTASQRLIINSADLVMTPVYQQIYNVFEVVLKQVISGVLAVDFSDFSDNQDYALLVENIDKVDVAFFGLNIDQVDIIYRIEKIAQKYNKLMVITLGADGSVAFKGNEKFKIDAKSVNQVVDTTGAGDAFAAGFLSNYMHGESIKSALDSGAEIAAITVQHKGAIPGD